MRFDDSLETVLAGDMSTPLGIQAAWRQLVDLIGRRRAAPNPDAIERLRSIRADVPPPVRAASARMLAFANPPAALVRLFADDEMSIAAPVLRTARLMPHEWVAMLSTMPSANRSILRNRRDLGPMVVRALESFGPADFVLPPADLTPEVESASPLATETTEIEVADKTNASHPVVADDAPGDAPVVPQAPDIVSAPSEASDAALVALAGIAIGNTTGGSRHVVVRSIPQQRVEQAKPAIEPRQVGNDPGAGFPISDIVARIDAYQRQRETEAEAPSAWTFDLPDPEDIPDRFRFETDAAGTIRWVDGVSRAALIGLSLDSAVASASAQVDGIASGAFRRRARFADARLVIDGASDAAGQWRITGTPVFDRATGRFTGYRGSGRRPRADERADPERDGRTVATDAVRQLVHELRTPTTAIAGFAEMIETEVLGPVPTPYRAFAGSIRQEAHGLLGAIEDLDTAARLDSNALDLKRESLPLQPLVQRIAADLEELAALRRTRFALMLEPGLCIAADERAAERLFGRLLATMLAAGSPDETLTITAAPDGTEMALISIDRPRALAVFASDALLNLDPEAVEGGEGAPLLGTGFALRLARNLAAELGGSLAIGRDRLTLRLPAAVNRDVSKATAS